MQDVIIGQIVDSFEKSIVVRRFKVMIKRKKVCFFSKKTFKNGKISRDYDVKDKIIDKPKSKVTIVNLLTGDLI